MHELGVNQCAPPSFLSSSFSNFGIALNLESWDKSLLGRFSLLRMLCFHFQIALNEEEKGKKKKINLELKALTLDVQIGQTTGTVKVLIKLLT